MEASGAPQEPSKRRRPALACTRCRRRKIRCDHKTPCNNCTKASNTGNCLYPESHSPVGRLSRAKASPQRQTLQSLAPRLAQSPVHESQSIPSPERGPTSFHQPLRNETSSSAALQFSDASNIEALCSRIGSLEKSILALSNSGQTPVTRHGTTARDQDKTSAELPNKSRPTRHWFANQSSWMNHTSLCSRVLRCLSQAQDANVDFRHRISQCTTLSQRIGVQMTSNVDAAPASYGTKTISKPVADQLLDSYFDTFAGVFHVFHAPSFRSEYEKYWLDPAGARDVFILQTQACMALGSMSSQDPLRFGCVTTQWLVEASSWVHRPPGWPRKRQTTIEELQLSCLLCLAEAGSPVTERLCWVDAGGLIRKAMSLNLHRDPSHLGIQEPREAALRRRLWATILELNLLMSLQAVQPPLISSTDWDTQVPAALLDEKTPAMASAQSSLAQSLHLRLLIASSIGMAEAPLAYNEVLRLHGQLARAHDQLKKDLTVQDRPITGNESHSLLADLVLSRYFLALHASVLGTSFKDPAFYFSRRACVAIAIRMLASCGITKIADDQANASMQQLFVNHAGLFRGLAMQPTYVLLLELVSSAEEQLDNTGALPAWDEAQIIQYADLSQMWMEKRLLAGSNEVHGCCFLAACRAYAAATTSEGEPDANQAIVDAAFQSTKRCQVVLAEALNKLESPSTTNSTFSSAELTRVEVNADPEILQDGWQDTFPMAGPDDLLGFDWTFLMDPNGPLVEGSGVNLPFI